MTDGLFTFGKLETVEIPSLGPQYAADPIALAPLGVLYRHKGNVYRYVQYYDTSQFQTDYAGNGEPVYWLILDPPAGQFIVCSDPDDSIGELNGLAGISQEPFSKVTHLKYFWAQVCGVGFVYFNTPYPTAGDKMIGGSGAYECEHINLGAINTDNIFGIVLDDVDITTDRNPVLLQNLMW